MIGGQSTELVALPECGFRGQHLRASFGLRLSEMELAQRLKSAYVRRQHGSENSCKGKEEGGREPSHVIQRMLQSM
jgi:hypothetical protein